MKKIFTLLFAGILFISCENKTASHQKYLIELNTTTDLETLLKEEKYPLVSAHRGGSAKGFPENCLETFERAVSFGPAIIETDIAMTKDLVLVLMHDDKLDRTTTGTGFVSDYTYSELQEFYLKDYQKTKTSYKIPTLDEALQWGKGKVVYTLDVKRGVPYEKVIESIRKNNAEAYSIVITYNANQARAFHKLAPDIWLSVSANGKEDIQRLKQYKVNTDKAVAFVGTAEPSTQTIAYMKSQNIPMILGTLGNLDKSAKVNGDQLYYSFFEKGIQILSADRNKEASQQALKFANDNQIQSKFINIQ
ncbi:MAG: glycerophosphodiester phosphodiesterase family protein [Myroides sp.]|nr:glycerophosphodiester phosphodiesterase family protein [Myroides sp.]